MSEIRNGVKEKIVKIIDNSIMAVLVDGRFNPSPYADEILAIPELAIVDRGAELPDNPAWHENEREFEAFCAGRNIMLQNDYVKEVK